MLSSPRMRWHSWPVDYTLRPEAPKIKIRPLKEIIRLSGVSSRQPLYLRLQNALTDTPEEAAMVRRLAQGFDRYITRLLDVARAEPWFTRPRLEEEYEEVYPEYGDAKDLDTRTLMGRLLTYEEVLSYIPPGEREKSLYFGANGGQDRALLGTDCAGQPASYYDLPGAPPMGNKLDPMHHYGPAWLMPPYGGREIMVCCSRPIGSPGCWIALDQNQPEGIPRPYRIATVDYWPALAEGLVTPQQLDFTEDYEVGTAFVQEEKYVGLHKKIQDVWRQRVAPQMGGIYSAYMSKLDQAIQDEKPLDLRASFIPLTTEQRAAAEKLMRLLHEYNEIQCREAPSAALDLGLFLQTTLFKTASVAENWTEERRGGVVGNNGVRLRLLPPVPQDGDVSGVFRAKLQEFRDALENGFPKEGIMTANAKTILLGLVALLQNDAKWREFQRAVDPVTEAKVDFIVNNAIHLKAPPVPVDITNYREKNMQAHMDMAQIVVELNEQVKFMRGGGLLRSERARQMAAGLKLRSFSNPTTLPLDALVAEIEIAKEEVARAQKEQEAAAKRARDEQNVLDNYVGRISNLASLKEALSQLIRLGIDYAILDIKLIIFTQYLDRLVDYEKRRDISQSLWQFHVWKNVADIRTALRNIYLLPTEPQFKKDAELLMIQLEGLDLAAKAETEAAEAAAAKQAAEQAAAATREQSERAAKAEAERQAAAAAQAAAKTRAQKEAAARAVAEAERKAAEERAKLEREQAEAAEAARKAAQEQAEAAEAERARQEAEAERARREAARPNPLDSISTQNVSVPALLSQLNLDPATINVADIERDPVRLRGLVYAAQRAADEFARVVGLSRAEVLPAGMVLAVPERRPEPIVLPPQVEPEPELVPPEPTTPPLSPRREAVEVIESFKAALPTAIITPEQEQIIINDPTRLDRLDRYVAAQAAGTLTTEEGVVLLSYALG